MEVGFVDKAGTIPFQLDTSIAGNRNSGHPFGARLTDEERKDIVEYLKTL